MQTRVVAAVGVCSLVVALLVAGGTDAAVDGGELDLKTQAELKQNFALCLSKLKGPYTENFCMCRDGKKLGVQGPGGAVRIPCANPIFCSAYRAPWAEVLAKHRMYIANIFSRDLYEWKSFPDHDDLVRGYVLEKYFTETNPSHKLAQMRQYRGLSSAEAEAPAQTAFFEKYLGSPTFTDNDYLLAYELQRRYFVREDVGQVEKVRNLAVRIERARADFKPYKDAVHNQISAGLIPGLAAYRDKLPPGSAVRGQVDELIVEIGKLTSLNESALTPLIGEIGDTGLRAQLAALVPGAATDPVEAVGMLGRLMVLARETVSKKQVSPADARRTIDVAITAGAVLQRRATALLEAKTPLTAEQNLRLLVAFSDGAYGAGLLNRREHQASMSALDALLAEPKQRRDAFSAKLKQAERVVEWAQGNADLAFTPVAAPWFFLLPAARGIRDDILRSSPLLAYAAVSRKLDDYAAGPDRPRHAIFGSADVDDVRALNPGLAVGRLRVAPEAGGYTRDDIVALPETPADLDPAAGILTQGEGNVLSHVQLLARALGIPNVVLGPAAYRAIAKHDGQRVVLMVTPGGRVILEDAVAMTSATRTAYEEYTRNEERTADGSLGGGGGKLHIDRSKIDLSKRLPIDLDDVRRKDSGVFCGPKAAYLGELKHLFPDHVARGIVVPFGAYYHHYQNAPVAVPAKLSARDVGATPGEPLPAFVDRTYREFFGTLIPARKSERELADWIQPRLDVIRESIQQAPLAPDLRQAIRASLEREGLLSSDGTSTAGCFIRSDTNVEDLDNFNGAGLNLTLFNRRSLTDIETGLKEVWASPFRFRSFSWRQTLIDDPAWVLASVVILESVPSDKSGVLVTADVNTGAPGKMLVATSEGVGGAVDGTSAETLLWSPEEVEIVTLFKSPWRNQLDADGGSRTVPSTGSDTVLEPAELKQLVAAGQRITEEITPVRDANGRPKPWDIEFGFAKGKLWLFQCRPFLGNDDLKNVPALAALDGTPSARGSDMLALSEVLR